MEKFDFDGFVRECYLRSEPSVDLNNVTKDKPIKCSDHKLAESEYDAILREYGVTDEMGNKVDPNSDVLTACNMWILQSGPQLYDNSKAA